MCSSDLIRHIIPSAKRMERNVNGATYCSAVLVATKPEPQIATKYQARAAVNQRDCVENTGKMAQSNARERDDDRREIKRRVTPCV